MAEHAIGSWTRKKWAWGVFRMRRGGIFDNLMRMNWRYPITSRETRAASTKRAMDSSTIRISDSFERSLTLRGEVNNPLGRERGFSRIFKKVGKLRHSH